MSNSILEKEDFQAILEHMPAAVLRITHQDGVWGTAYVNENISFYGYTPQQFYDGEMDWLKLVHPDDRVLVARLTEDYESHTIDEFRLNYRIIAANGDSVPVTEFSEVNRDEGGKIVSYDTIILNNTMLESSRQLIDDHYRQQTVMNDILMSLHDSDLDHGIQIILNRTGEYLDTSRALLFKDSPDHVTCKIVYEWCNKDIPSVMDLDYAITYSTGMPEIYVALQTTGMLLIDYGEIPENCKEEFESEGLVASAIFAVYLDGDHYGFVCFDDCVVHRKWDEDTVRFLKNISNLISTVVARQKAAEKLEQSQKTYEAVLDNVDSYIFVTKENSNEIIFANVGFKNAFGQDCEGRQADQYLDIPFDAMPTEHADSAYESVAETFSERTNEWLQVTSEPMKWVDGQKVRLYNCYDITAKKLYADTVEQLAFTDHLTKLPNRYRCDADLREAMEAARQAEKPGYLLFIDMDDFKVVNDCYGHDYGDEILKSFAAYLTKLLDEPNKVFRFGGDEFVIIISHLDADNLQYYLDELLRRAMQPWSAMDKEFYCTLSIGVVEFPGQDIQSVIKNADIAMYEAKRSGKNKYQFYEEHLSGGPQERSDLEELLRKGMEKNFEGFVVHYQPVVDASSKRIVGAEALLRLRNGDKLVYPGEFIPLAEYLGFILPIGEYILEQAVQTLQQIAQPDFYIEVNLSESQINQPDILKRMEQIMQPVDKSRIVISITESTAVGNEERALPICRMLQNQGVRVALREFGGGNSSFIRLAEMPVDAVNLSVLFMKELDKTRDFVDLLIKLSHASDKQVRLNGVEGEAQMDYAQGSGADQLMGNGLYPEADREGLLKLL